MLDAADFMLPPMGTRASLRTCLQIHHPTHVLPLNAMTPKPMNLDLDSHLQKCVNR
jgi:hypothetical protein